MLVVTKFTKDAAKVNHRKNILDQSFMDETNFIACCSRD